MRSGGSAAKRSGGWRNCGGDNAGFSGLAGGSFLALVGGMSAWSPVFPALVTSGEMRALEEAAVAAGRSEEALMDAASLALAQTVQEWLPRPGAAVVFAGKGHNAGDAFGLAGHLVEAGWRVEVRLAWPEGELRPLAARKLAAIRARVTWAALDAEAVPEGRPLLLIDGVLGIGGSGRLQGAAAGAVRALNALRHRRQALALAVDLPSGLGGDEEPVAADLTATLGWPKDFLLADEASAWVGRLVALPLAGLAAPEGREARDFLVTAAGLRAWLPPRPAFSRHKGQSGRIGLVAGSVGLTGAARLAATAAALMGGGLVTLFCPRDAYAILAASCPPEVMVRPVGSCGEVRDFPLDALGLGPGMGASALPGLAELLREDARPLVVDADALNGLAAGPGLGRGGWGGPRLFTPHPGELGRLMAAAGLGQVAGGRRQQAQALAEALGVTVLAKSARSLVVEAGRPAAWNGSGHPLMARGGMGDVLTGFLTTWAAQGLPLYRAAALGSWALGRGAELFHRASGHEETGLASEVMAWAAGAAMAELRGGWAGGGGFGRG